MAVTIASDSTVITPDLVLQHQDELVGGSIVHHIIGRSNPDVTLRPGVAPTGTLKLFFMDAAAAQDARDAHLAPVVFRIVAEAQPWLPHYYVMQRLSRVQQDSNRSRWVIEVGYQEVML